MGIKACVFEVAGVAQQELKRRSRDCGRSGDAIETKLRQLSDGTTTKEPAKIGADRVKRSGAVNCSCAGRIVSR